MISKNIFEIGNISLSVAWIFASAYVFAKKETSDAILFMGVGFIAIIFLRVLEYTFIEHMKEKDISALKYYLSGASEYLKDAGLGLFFFGAFGQGRVRVSFAPDFLSHKERLAFIA